MSQNIRMHNFFINRPKWFLGNWPPVLLSVDHQYFCLSNALYHSKTFKLKKDLHTESWDIRVWDELGKNCRVFLTNRMEGSLQPLAKSWLIRLATRKNFDASWLSPPPTKKKKSFIPLTTEEFPCYNLIKTSC